MSRRASKAAATSASVQRRSTVRKTARRTGTAEPLAPRRPDERDESADQQEGGPRPVIQQAADDVERGLVDTDERSRRAAEWQQRNDRDNRSQSTDTDRPDEGEEAP